LGSLLGTSDVRGLWVLGAGPLMAAVQMMCARIGKVTGQGLAGNFSRRFPGWLLRVFIVALLVANTINIAADLAGMADAAEMLSGINSHFCVVVFALLISWATVRLQYHQIANVLKWLVLVLFAYPITAFVVGADWGQVARATLIPSLPHTRDEWSMLVAILGTTISPYLFFWQTSEEVEEEKSAGQNTLAKRRGATLKELELRNIDVGVGAFFSNVVMFFIILTTAITLNRHGINHSRASLPRPCLPSALSASDFSPSRRWLDRRPMPSRKRWDGARPEQETEPGPVVLRSYSVLDGRGRRTELRAPRHT
jgi:Mn2+/Fe2+ NRAMP family transporter